MNINEDIDMGKMTFRQWVENLWYHNKFALIVITVFLIFISVSTVQLFTKDKPDANLLYMGPAAIAFRGEGYLQESIATVMKEDYNNDGKRYVDYIELTALDPSDTFDDETGDFATGYTTYDVQKTVGDSFAAQIIAGDSMIYLLDEKYFGVAKDTNVLMPLSEALGYTPDLALNEYAIRLSDLDIYYMPGFNLFPDTTLICIRYPVTLTSGKKEVEKREQCNLSVFRDMVSYKYENKPEKPVEAVPQEIDLDSFKALLRDYSAKKKLDLSDTDIESAIDFAPDGFFEKTGANLFKADGVSYLVYCGKIYVLGKHLGGSGIIDVEICNFDGNEQNDIIFSYSYKNSDAVVSSVSVFNFTTLKETFLSLTSPLTLILKANDNAQIDVFGVNNLSSDYIDAVQGKHLYTIYGDKKDVLIKAIN